MLWDSTYTLNTFCKFTNGRLINYRYLDPQHAVEYIVDKPNKNWIKRINLDKCDRTSLSTLLDFIAFLQNLSPSHLNNTISDAESDSYSFLDLPSCITLKEHIVSLSYVFSNVGSVFDLLFERKEGLSEVVVATIISRTVVCLHKLHNINLLHRGLCSKHLLFKPNSNLTMDIVLCGLGSMSQSPAYSATRNDLPCLHLAWRGWQSSEQNSDRYTNHPIAWYSPEQLAQEFKGYSWSSDIYSLGIIIYELFTGHPPYLNAPASVIFLQKMLQTDSPNLKSSEQENNPSAKMLAVYEACTQYNPNDRPSTEDLLQMPWIEWGLKQKLTIDQLYK